MTTKRVTSRQNVADRLITTLGTFVSLAVAWIVLHLTADVIDPFGLLSLLAGVSFLLAIVALLGVLVVAGSLLRH